MTGLFYVADFGRYGIAGCVTHLYTLAIMGANEEILSK